MFFKSLFSFLILGLSLQAFSCGNIGGGFLPENDMWIEPELFDFLKDDEKVIDEETFNEIIDKVEEVYTPIVRELGGELKVGRSWKDGTVNAYAIKRNSSWMIQMFGGLARHPDVGPDAFALVACHEIGHLIAGYPQKEGGEISSEAQSDYFAGAKCFKALYGNDDNSFVYTQEFSGVMENACEAVYQDENDRATCIRSMIAAKDMATFLAEGQDQAPSLKNPSRKEVREHEQGYPSSQCRFDSYFQGALCDKGAEILYSTTKYASGYCTRAEGYKQGVRPLCWFNPEQAEFEKNGKKKRKNRPDWWRDWLPVDGRE